MATTGFVNGTLKKIQIGSVAIEEQIDATFSFSRELIPFINKDTNSYTEYEYGKAAWEVSGKAHLTYDAVTGYETLLDALINKTKLVLTYTTDQTGDMEITGTVLIDSLSDSAGTEDGVEFDFSFKGSGAPTKQDVV